MTGLVLAALLAIAEPQAFAVTWDRRFRLSNDLGGAAPRAARTSQVRYLSLSRVQAAWEAAAGWEPAPQTLIPDASSQSTNNPLGLSAEAKTLTWNDYTFSKAYDQAREAWAVQVARQGTLIAVLSGDAVSEADVSIGLVKLLGGDAMQLAVRFHNGGLRCCDTYRIAALAPGFRTIFTTRPYPLNTLLGAADIDHDGRTELWFRDTAFEGFHAASDESPAVTAYFRYDPARGAYMPANRVLADIVLRGIDGRINAVRAASAHQDFSLADPGDAALARFRRDLLDVMLDLLYAGRRVEAWRLYETEYRGPNKPELKQEIMDRLSEDPFYEAVKAER